MCVQISAANFYIPVSLAFPWMANAMANWRGKCCNWIGCQQKEATDFDLHNFYCSFFIQSFRILFIFSEKKNREKFNFVFFWFVLCASFSFRDSKYYIFGRHRIKRRAWSVHYCAPSARYGWIHLNWSCADFLFADRSDLYVCIVANPDLCSHVHMFKWHFR